MVNSKNWYKNSIVIGLILASVAWFSWVTKQSIIVSSKADDSKIEIADNKLNAINNALSQLERSLTDRDNKQDATVSALMSLLREHERQQTGQIEKIYSLLVQMSKDNKASFQENKGSRKN